MSGAQTCSWRVCLTLLLLATLAWFSILDYRKLIKPDEGRYAEIAREMAQSGDFVTPRLNGIKYFEKPPLQYWATATAFRLFGEDEWSARLWSALTGCAGVLLAAWSATRLFGTAAGLSSGLVLGSSLWWVLLGHLNTLDMSFAFFLQASLSGFLLAQTAPRNSTMERNGMLAAWGAAALAVLSKGLAGLVLPGMVLVVYCLAQRDAQPLKRLHLARGLPLFLLLTAPWFLAVQNANPEFARFFFIHEHFERFLSTAHRREQPVWYYLPVLAAALLPWSGIAIHAAAISWRAASAHAFNARRFLLLWAILIFAFFSASGSKLPSYILPVLPALALLAGDWLAGARHRTLIWHFAAVAAIALIAAALFAAFGMQPGSVWHDEAHLNYAAWLAVALAIIVAALITAMAMLRQSRASAALAGVALASLIGWGVVLQGHATLGRSTSAFYIAEQIKPLLRPGVPFYSVGTYEQTLPFYLDRTVTLVDYLDEFSFGLEQEPQHAIADMAAFKARWMADKEAFAMMTPERYKRLALEDFPMRIVASDPDRIIVAKP